MNKFFLFSISLFGLAFGALYAEENGDVDEKDVAAVVTTEEELVAAADEQEEGEIYLSINVVNPDIQ